MCFGNTDLHHNLTEPEPHLKQFSQINYSNLETGLNVMKNFEEKHQIQVQIRLVRNYKIQIHQKTANPQDLNPNQCSSLVPIPQTITQKLMVLIFYLNARSLFNKKKRCVLLHMILLYVALQQTTHDRKKGFAITCKCFHRESCQTWK